MKHIELKISFNVTEKDYKDCKDIAEMLEDLQTMVDNENPSIPENAKDFNVKLTTK